MKLEDPVSVVIVSYNSAKTIIETLDSIYNQDYEKFELIISDDCSTDNTVKLAKSWCERHKNRFINLLVHVNQVNKGISANLNTGMRLAKYEWIKILGADDLLCTSCISNNVKFVVDNKCNSVVTSRMVSFKEVGSEKQMIKSDLEELIYIKKIGKQVSKKQYVSLLKRDILNTPTMFLNASMYQKIDGCDERIRNIEDWALKVRITGAGYKLYFMDKTTVMYRVGESVSHTNKGMLNIKHIEQVALLKELICYPNIPKWHIIYYYEEFILRLKDKIIIDVFDNKNKAVTRMINKALLILLPRKWSKIINTFLR